MSRTRLTPKQSRFVEEYLIDLNATQAAIRSGYSQKTAYSVGHEILKKPEVQAAIDDRVQERSLRTQIDSTYVLQRLVEIDQMDVIDILDDDGRLKPLQDWPKVWRTTISGLDVSELWEGHDDERQMVGLLKKVKWPDKPKNLELLGKHVTVQAWKEQRELSGRLTTTHEEALEALE